MTNKWIVVDDCVFYTEEQLARMFEMDAEYIAEEDLFEGSISVRLGEEPDDIEDCIYVFDSGDAETSITNKDLDKYRERARVICDALNFNNV